MATKSSTYLPASLTLASLFTNKEVCPSSRRNLYCAYGAGRNSNLLLRIYTRLANSQNSRNGYSVSRGFVPSNISDSQSRNGLDPVDLGELLLQFGISDH